MVELTRITELKAKDPADADFSLQTDPVGLYLRLTRGINELPSVRGVDQTVPHRPGRIARSRVEDSLALELEGLLLGIPDDPDDPDGAISYRTQQLALREVLRRKRNPWALSGTLEDGSTATINVRCVDYLITELIDGLVAEVKVALESVDPDWVITPAP